MASPVHYEKLLTAARTVIAKLQAVPELEHVKVCIIGGFAVWQKYRDYRETEDIDFLIALDPNDGFDERVQSLPSGITQLFKLGLRLNNPGEFKPSGELYYLEIYDPLELESQWIPIDFINSQLVDLNNLPFISALDLLAFKINTCGLRPSGFKKRRDANDALTIIKDLDAQGQISLSDQQKRVVEQGLDSIVEVLEHRYPKYWWEVKLNMYW